MKRVFAVVAVALLLAGAGFSQSLADVARQNRQAKETNKKAAKVYTNDDIPSVTVMRDTPKPAAESNTSSADQKAPDAQSAVNANKSADTGKTELQTQADKFTASYRTTFQEAKKTIALLERELMVAQREHQIQLAVYYSDPGTKLRAPKVFLDQEKAFDDEIKAKKKALDEAKLKLEEVEEQARKAGVNLSTP